MAKHFPVATFKRVFDTAPAPDLVSLDALIYGLTHFLHKGKLAASVNKGVRQVDDALAELTRGNTAPLKSTRVGRRILGAFESRGIDAAKTLGSDLRGKIAGRAKTDLRLWSPADYTPNQKRGADAVRSISCLVLDFDGGIDPMDATRLLSPHFVIAHSTWSHSPAIPKFRLCLPFSQPIRAADFRAVWEFASQRVKRTCDQALKSPGSTFALPASANRASAFSFVHEGPLFDPVRDGLAQAGPEVISQPAKASHFRDTDGEKRIAAGGWKKTKTESWEAEFEGLFGGPAETPEASAHLDNTAGCEGHQPAHIGHSEFDDTLFEDSKFDGAAESEEFEDDDFDLF